MAKAKSNSPKVVVPSLFVALGFDGDAWVTGVHENREEAIQELRYNYETSASVTLEITGLEQPNKLVKNVKVSA